MTQEEIAKFQEKILSWYEGNKRDLPWRTTKDPYKILVSEIMSQQTQIARVVPKYEAWLQRFPNIKSLAEAPAAEVLRYWSGLGYNRRALNLQKTAQAIVNSGRNAFPTSVEELKKLPGIGQYTASAVVCFAYDAQIPVIDTNIRKVIIVEILGRICHCEELKMTKQSHNKDCRASLAATEGEIENIAQIILPKGRASEWNQALMDYSSLVLKSVKIPIAKQSHFKSSDRWYRGQTVKLLLEIKKISFSGLLDYFADINPIDGERLDVVLLKLSKDGLVDYKDRTISIR